MAETRRPYKSLSIEEIEAIYKARSGEIDAVRKIVHELSFRNTNRAKQHHKLASERLIELEANGQTEVSENSRELASDDEAPDDEAPEEEEYTAAIEDEAGADQPPDDRRQPKYLSRIRKPGTPGLPTPWAPALNTDKSLNLPSAADLPQVYSVAIAALIAEIKSTGAGQKRYQLENGVRVKGNEAIYEFAFTDEAELFEDAKVEVEIFGRRVSGSIVSISSGRLWLSLTEELGGVLQQAILLVDTTALLEALKQRIEEASKGEISLNRVIADAVVGKKDIPPDAPPIPEAHSDTDLDAAKRKAQRRALTASITYIWGPPGCGKTRVLSEIVRSNFHAGKRVLVCSNTNKAVDQVIFQICENLGEKHEAMQEGRIVRLGTIADAKLSDTYNDFVTIDGIVERRSADLKSRLIKIQTELEQIDQKTANARAVLDRFIALDNAQRKLDAQLEATNTLARTGRDLNTEIHAALQKIRELNAELEKRRNAVFTIFMRSEQTIQKDIVATQDKSVRLQSELDSVKTQYSQAKTNFETAKTERDRIHLQLGGLDRSLAERIIAAADKARTPLIAELREIEAKIGDLRTSIVREARVLGTTCTKTYLSVKEIGQVDTVIVDEASMVLLPMVWFVAGLTKERVIICGDFRQIPPIVQTRQQAIFDVLGKDVFSQVGLDKVGANDSRMIELDTQYRMDKEICELISVSMYGGSLKTAVQNEPEQLPPPPYDGVLTIIDTSDLWPFESVNAFKSRFNLMQALLSRNLAWHLRQNGYVQSKDDFAICTPYAAQAKLISKLIEGEGLGSLVQVGTVHSFQGDERNTIVLELPEGYGGAKMLGQFLQGVPPTQVGARLINVAVSRAKHHLIIIANLTHLDRWLPSSSFLREILYNMQNRGRVVASTDLLKLRPIESDLQGLFDRVPLDMDAKTMGIFNQTTFDAAVEADLVNAKDSIVIFSGFVTPSRVAKLGDLLRMKTSNGVTVRCVTRPPHLNGTMDPQSSKEALDALEKMKCVVDCRARIHEKIILIDKEIVWHGSLNVLSHTHRTDESMTRIVNSGLAKALAANVSKRRISAEKALQTVGDAENPRCEVCGSRTVYFEGKYGPFFRCEDQGCDWSINLRNVGKQNYSNANKEAHGNFPKDGPACPLCKGKTTLRNGKYGAFYSCANYPDCKGTVNVAPKSPRRGRKRPNTRLDVN